MSLDYKRVQLHQVVRMIQQAKMMRILKMKFIPWEVILAKAKYHVQMYQIQRNWATKVISIARLDITYHLLSLFRRKVLTIDMGQNLCLPNLEVEQTGDTYYMSPLTVLIFGVVNNSIDYG